MSLRIIKNPKTQELALLLSRPLQQHKKITNRVKAILHLVKEKGDEALVNLTEEFDGVRVSRIDVTADEIAAAGRQLSAELKSAIEIAVENIRKFHVFHIKPDKSIIETMPGVKCWKRQIPIQKVGLYIPGGSAPLFSTVLMLGIPAGLAGCEEIILCTPPDTNGKINPAILFAAFAVGIRKIYKVGGAQAIAAMAYGTKTVPEVYKIFGPGNAYVAKAKELVQSDGISVDVPAGPSELLVWADDSAEPKFVASDLLAQAEHGPDSQVILVSSSLSTLKKVLKEIKNQLVTLPRKQIIKKALNNSRFIYLKSPADILKLVNTYAPEHLILNIRNAERTALSIQNAGSVFLGNYSPTAAGDYASGTNHTLPTHGWARTFSGVSVETFTKQISFQQISKKGAVLIGPVVKTMAEAEQLQAHKFSMQVRIDNQNDV